MEEIILHWDLIDVKPKQGNYARSNRRIEENHIAAKIDRFLIQSSLLLEGKLIKSQILANLVSDHKPILLRIQEEENLDPIPFRFSPLWITLLGFLEIISTTWKILIEESYDFVWDKKLNNTKKIVAVSQSCLTDLFFRWIVG